MGSTPTYLNPPSFPFSLENFVADQAAQDQRLKLFISSSLPYGGASCSLSFPAFFDSLTDQSGISSTIITVGDQALLYKGQRANKSIWQGETSYDQVCSSSSLVHPVSTDVSNEEYRKLSVSTDQIIENNEDHESNTNRPVKWTPLTMKLMQKMTHEPDQVPEKIPLTYKFQSARRDDQHRETNTGETSSSSSLTISINKSSSSIVSAVRVCSDCSTNTTPLWRSGPLGPKSLCNACGIRQRKARRSMAEAAAATGLAGGTTGPAATSAATTAKSSSMSKGKGKKSRQNRYVTVSCKKKRKLVMTDDSTSTAAPSIYYKRNEKQLCNFKQVAASPPSALFPRDVEEAAILLMDLSSGLSMNHS